MTYPRFAGKVLTLGFVVSAISTAAAQGLAGAPSENGVWAVVRNFAGIPTEFVSEAERIVNATYDRAGIQVRWVTLEDVKQMLPSNPVSSCTFTSLVLVNLLIPSAALDWPRDVMGATAPDARYIRIAAQRIEQRAVDEHVSFGFLLGQVMAHELGHVFLPHLPHALDGLMRETIDVHQAQQSPLLILPTQAADMRATIASQLSGCPR